MRYVAILPRLVRELYYNTTYNQKYVLVFMYSTRYSCQILMEVEFTQQLFVEHSNTKFNEKRSVGVELFRAD